MGEELLTLLRCCFTAGYTFPQYCIDNKIKKPLFVSEKKFELFLWEIHYQFRHDKRLPARFCFTDSNEISYAGYASEGFNGDLKVKNLSEMNLDNFDKIIFLDEKIPKVNNKNCIDINELRGDFFKKVYVEIPLLHFLQRYPKVKLFLTNFPYAVKKIKGFSEFNSQLWGSNKLLSEALIDSQSKGIIMPTPFDKLGYTNSQVISLLKSARSKKQLDATTIMFDDDDPLIQIKHGKRLTAYQPEKFLNRIYIVGTCHHFGINAPFDKTIASYLQKMLNENNLPYRVENEGQCYHGRWQDIFYNLNKLDPAPGDIIFIYIGNREINNLPFCNVDDVFNPPHDFKEIFCRKGHVNELGYKLLAERYFDFLTKNNFFRDVEFNYPLPPPHITGMVYLLGQSRAA